MVLRDTFVRDVAPGIHVVTHAHTNCYLVTDDDGVTLVDAAFPRTWDMVQDALASLGRSVDDVRALLLTHGHFDHLGFARHAQQAYGIPVWAHLADLHICRHPYRYRPQRPRLLYPLAYPRSLPVLTRMTLAGALRVSGVEPDSALVPDTVLPVPGRPLVIFTPGHTDGSCVFFLPDRDAVISGDTLVTLDPYLGWTGPRIIARAATSDARQAFRSADSLRALPARHVLPGHGDPWHGGIRDAVEEARAAFLQVH